MTEFPTSAPDNLDQAKALVAFLRKRGNTMTASEWTRENIGLLDEYFRKKGLACFHSSSQDGSEFLWDFAAYAKNHGILIVAESEHSKSNYALTYDFEKLFYARSTMKLFICRVGRSEEAEEQSEILNKFMHETCKVFSPGEIFILYFVWWAEEGGPNRDVAYFLQVDGPLNYVGIEGKKFQRIEVGLL
jgi:hypothetical protein